MALTYLSIWLVGRSAKSALSAFFASDIRCLCWQGVQNIENDEKNHLWYWTEKSEKRANSEWGKLAQGPRRVDKCHGVGPHE